MNASKTRDQNHSRASNDDGLSPMTHTHVVLYVGPQGDEGDADGEQDEVHDEEDVLEEALAAIHRGGGEGGPGSGETTIKGSSSSSSSSTED